MTTDFWAGFVHGVLAYFLLQLAVGLLALWQIFRTKERA